MIGVEGTDEIAIPSMDDPRYRDGGYGFINFCNHFVRIPVYYLEDVVPVWTPLHNLPDEEWRPGVSYKSFWELQCEVALEALVMEGGRFKHRQIVLCWMRGEGKCLKQGTEVIMYDGTLKKVEDIKIGDLLMGDDNTSRKVLSLASGREEMFEVVPMRGESFTVTADHKLSLKRRKRIRHTKDGRLVKDSYGGRVVDISVRDYEKQSKNFKNNHLLYRVPVDWSAQEVPLDPYFLGLWLADGHSHKPSITTMDDEVVQYLYEYAHKQGLQVTVNRKPDNKAASYNLVTPGGQDNPLLILMRELGLLNNKHIPQVYKINSREVRMQILAGILDGDGYVNRNSFQLALKRKSLCEDVAFIARSLGFHAGIKKCKKGIKSTGFVGEYYRMCIVGDCSVIPVNVARRKCTPRSDWKDILVTGVKEIKSVGEQDYYGFMLDGNHRFLLSDFTVTHNSFLAVLLQVWKFMCWPAQTIVLGANSKDQIKFVHFDIIRDIIINSPFLLDRVGGMKQIQEKEIRRHVWNEDNDERRYNVIRAISSFSGIVSNITGYTFSEIFDMKNLKFYYQLDGSIRNIPNALGVIDSTVSTKDHILFTLYELAKKREDDTLFFSYRHSSKGLEVDYWNPQMHQKQLNSYRSKFPPAEYARYFLNTWSSGARSMFSREQVLSVFYLGVGGSDSHGKLMDALEKKVSWIDESQDSAHIERTGITAWNEEDYFREIKKLEGTLMPVSSVYKFDYNTSLCTLDDLARLSELYNTDFAIMIGIDRSDPMASKGARTIFTVIAKGCKGSRGLAFSYTDQKALDYCYFILGLEVVEENTLEYLKNLVIKCNNEFDEVDAVCSERYGCFDLAEWATTQGMNYKAIHNNFEKQRDMFSELYSSIANGNFKSPFIDIPGSKGQDILQEELEAFIMDEAKRWFGSPEKNVRNGIQDDAVYAIGNALYGGMELMLEDFRPRKIKSPGFIFIQGDTAANY